MSTCRQCGRSYGVRRDIGLCPQHEREDYLHRCRTDPRYVAMRRAVNLVQGAIRRGELRRPTEFSCEDCGGPAREYDHRDYARPLEVAPVCHRCNKLRGPGSFPPLPIAA